MKSKILLKCLACAAVLVMLSACSSNFTEVRIEVADQQSLTFEKYDRVIYTDLVLESAPENYNPEKELNVFFLEDLPRILKKDVEHISVEGKTIEEKIENLKSRIKETSGTIAVTGKLTFGIKSRSKIAEKKGKKGKKERKFVKVEHWTLSMDIALIDLETGKEFFQDTYTEKLADAESKNPKYNFDALFFKINNRFGRQVTTVKKNERRYLLHQ